MTEGHRRENIALEVALARRKALDAAALLAAQGYGSAISLSYYSAFHFATALLLMEGQEARTHGGVSHLLNMHFVRTGRLAPAVAGLLSQLFGFRQQADYDAASIFDQAMAIEWLDKAAQFGEAATRLLTDSGYLD